MSLKISFLSRIIITLITGITNTFMNRLDMFLKMRLCCSFILTVVARIADTLMFGFFMFHKMPLLSSFVITLVTGIPNTFMFWLLMFSNVPWITVFIYCRVLMIFSLWITLPGWKIQIIYYITLYYIKTNKVYLHPWQHSQTSSYLTFLVKRKQTMFDEAIELKVPTHASSNHPKVPDKRIGVYRY